VSAWETQCPEHFDGWHCNCWYDGEPCCACGDDTPPRGGPERGGRFRWMTKRLPSMTRRLAALGCAVRAFEPMDTQRAVPERRAELIVRMARRFERYLATAE
jgi:hypothetical protein